MTTTDALRLLRISSTIIRCIWLHAMPPLPGQVTTLAGYHQLAIASSKKSSFGRAATKRQWKQIMTNGRAFHELELGFGRSRWSMNKQRKPRSGSFRIPFTGHPPLTASAVENGSGERTLDKLRASWHWRAPLDSKGQYPLRKLCPPVASALPARDPSPAISPAPSSTQIQPPQPCRRNSSSSLKSCS
jgi:hypothetical protein